MAPIAPSTANPIRASTGGSPEPTKAQAACATRAPTPAPTIAMPTKYANSRIAAPTRPPTRAATTRPAVLLMPISELTSIAPRMKPKIARTMRNSR